MLGIGLSVWPRGNALTALQKIAALYAGGSVPGVLLPAFSDYSKLYQDLAGTTPVTAVEQFVGRILDVSGNGHRFVQASDPARLKLSARWNDLEKTDQLNGAGWANGGLNIIPNAATLADGTRVDKIYPIASGSYKELYQQVSPSRIAGVVYKSRFLGKAGGLRWLAMGHNGFPNTSVFFDLVNGSVGSAGPGLSGAIEADPANPGYYFCTVTLTSWATNYVDIFPSDTDGGVAVTANGTDGYFVTKVQHGPAATFGPYQRVNTAADYTSVGFRHYLECDGIDGMMATAAPVDFTGTNKMTVCMNLRIDTANTGMVIELSDSAAANAGAWGYATSVPNSGQDYFITTGTGPAQTLIDSVPIAAPRTAVTTGIFDKSATATQAIRMRRDGTVPAQTAAGTPIVENFGNYPIYLGARAGTAIPFAGRIYGGAAIGKDLTPAQLALLEAYVANPDGV